MTINGKLNKFDSFEKIDDTSDQSMKTILKDRSKYELIECFESVIGSSSKLTNREV